MKLLHIIASPRGTHSRTLDISRQFISTLKIKDPQLEVDNLDLHQEDFPEVTDTSVAAKYMLVSGSNLTHEAATAWEVIGTHAKRFLDADMYLITSPMWNFSIPYKLKHYLDLIVQPGHLFTFTENGVEGLVRGKKMICIISSGSDYSEGSPLHSLDFVKPYLRAIFGFVGITDIEFIQAQPLDYGPELAKIKLKEAQQEAISLAQNVI